MEQIKILLRPPPPSRAASLPPLAKKQRPCSRPAANRQRDVAHPPRPMNPDAAPLRCDGFSQENTTLGPV